MRLTCLALLLAFTSTLLSAGPDITAGNARVMEAPPTVQVHAAYLDIVNTGESSIELIAVKSPLYDSVEIHLSEVKGGVARMRRQNSITVPANTTFSLRPGEYHLMLFNNRQPVRAGDTVPLELLFANGTSVTLSADVIRGNNDHSRHHH